MNAYRVEIRVMPRGTLLDPQGQAVEHALHALGFREAAKVRVLASEIRSAAEPETLPWIGRLLGFQIASTFAYLSRQQQQQPES